MVRKKLKRVRVGIQPNASAYFDALKASLTFIPTGSQALDLVLGGGWAEGRIVNVVGDKSTGKTLLAIEAAANFIRTFPDGIVYYDDAEAAFDEPYAEIMGLPVSSVTMLASDLVEDFNKQLDAAVTHANKTGKRALYVLDSIDSLSDLAEQGREFEKGSFGTKAKQVSELFRRQKRKLRDAGVTLLIISQVRDNIGVTFGRKHKRSGGKALDFYASQVLWLSEKKKLERTRNGVKRPYGVLIIGKCEKNKVGLPFRRCEFPVVFYYGLDDVESMRLWLLENNYKQKAALERLCRSAASKDADAYAELVRVLHEHWNAVEQTFMPKSRKYS